MRHASEPTLPAGRGWPRLRLVFCLAVGLAWLPGSVSAQAADATALASRPIPLARCARPLYLTLDTGHMGVAQHMAEVLRRQQVRATFFAANEATQDGQTSLGESWAAWWRARAQEGHAFASHTWDHAYWRADLPGVPPRFRIRPTAGAQAGRESTWHAQDYCANLDQASRRLRALTGVAPLPLFRAPGGKTSAPLLAAARACGYAHVGWSPEGFLGDELPTARASNAQLLAQALQRIRPGAILMAHLGIWSRQPAWEPEVFEPLLAGLKAQGYCFLTLDQHPDYQDWVRSHPLASGHAE